MESTVNFVRYRDGETGDPFWSWKIKGAQQDPIYGENRFATLEESLADYFAYDGHEDIVVALGVSFPGNHGPLMRVSDDLYQITKSVEA